VSECIKFFFIVCTYCFGAVCAFNFQKEISIHFINYLPSLFSSRFKYFHKVLLNESLKEIKKGLMLMKR